MGSLGAYVREYTAQLREGQIQEAYRGIMAFMSDLKAYLERKYPDYAASALYPGYMDMTYFAFTPPTLKGRNLKIAVVFLHEACRFELWLAASNRQIRADYIKLLSQRDLRGYTLTPIRPAVDSIIASVAVEQPDFDNPDELKHLLEAKTMGFARDMDSLSS